MRKVFLGIDPGKEGAVASIIEEDGKMVEIKFYDPALFSVKDGTKVKNEYNEADMCRSLQALATEGDEVYCVLEKVSAMPGQGVTSMFNFGMGYGMWRGMLSAFKIPYSLVHPLTWKNKVMRDMPKEKEAAAERVLQLFPQVIDQVKKPRKGYNIGRCDALLMAHYARTFNQ